jgi:hypothetical protein
MQAVNGHTHTEQHSKVAVLAQQQVPGPARPTMGVTDTYDMAASWVGLS